MRLRVAQYTGPALSNLQISVLAHLAERYPRLCTLDDLEAPPLQLSRKTASGTVAFLIQAGLACRPQGERLGATATKKGQTLAQQFTR